MTGSEPETLRAVRLGHKDTLHVVPPGNSKTACGQFDDVEFTSDVSWRVYRLDVAAPDEGDLCGRCSSAANWWYHLDNRKKVRQQYKKLLPQKRGVVRVF